MEENRVKIYSYSKVWKVEKKIYSISNIPLPRPINPYDLLAFLGSALFMLVLGAIIPAFSAIPAIIKFIAFPYLITNYIMKKKLDGKNPIKYLISCIFYLFTIKGAYLQGFNKYPDKKSKINLNWNCSMGRQQ